MDRFIDACPDTPSALRWRKHTVPARFLHIGFESIDGLQAGAGIYGKLVWAISNDIAVLPV